MTTTNEQILIPMPYKESGNNRQKMTHHDPTKKHPSSLDIISATPMASTQQVSRHHGVQITINIAPIQLDRQLQSPPPI
jgi:hypothetical protein